MSKGPVKSTLDRTWVKRLEEQGDLRLINEVNICDYPGNVYPYLDKEPPIMAGISIKEGPDKKHILYTNRLLHSIWISDVPQPVEILLSGWNFTQEVCSDIYMGRNFAVRSMAQFMDPNGIIAQVDNDIVLPPRWYSAVRKIMDDPKVAVVFPMMYKESDRKIQGIDNIHDFDPDDPVFIHPGKNLVELDEERIMGTVAWRCTDMCVFYRAAAVKDFLHYHHDWFIYKVRQGWKVILAKDFSFVPAHYKAFGERECNSTRFFVCRTCNHVCSWEMVESYTCPTCNTVAERADH